MPVSATIEILPRIFDAVGIATEEQGNDVFLQIGCDGKLV